MPSTPIDDMYLDNLSEFVFDDRKVVTYKFLSVTLGVHVNTAKRMLYEFSKRNEGKVHVIYYVSGTAPFNTYLLEESERQDGQEPMEVDSETPSSTTDSQKDMFEDFDSVSKSLECMYVTLCHGEQLEKVKKNMTKVFSVHVYAVSGTPWSKYSYDPSEDFLVNANGLGPVDFGPVKCLEGLKIRDDVRPLASVQPKNEPVVSSKDVIKEKNNSVSVTKKPDVFEAFKSKGDNSKSDNSKSEKSTFTKHNSTTSTSSASSKKSDGNRLKSMFTAAAAKPPRPAAVTIVEPVEEKKLEIAEKPKGKETSVKSTSTSNKKVETKRGSSSNKKKQSQTVSKKRKRIRDVFSSSDSENDSDIECKKSESESEDDNLPESPLPSKNRRSTNVIQSDDSDDDFKDTSTRNTKPAETVVLVPGKKRVSKTISKTYMDEDGFLVTEKEQMMASESENSEGEALSESPLPHFSSKNVEKDKPAPSPPKKPAVVINAKTKQSSLMSFFKKT